MEAITGISITNLIIQASFPVQIIILILFLMFLTSLYISACKIVQFRRLQKKIRNFYQIFWSNMPLDKLYNSYDGNKVESIERIFFGGYSEFETFNGSLQSPDTIVNNCRRAMEAALNRECRDQEERLSILATFASSAPYIGLLGTVYGIMNSFIAIGGTDNTSIASVAPGIAEALIATAVGLFAAIPAVLSYNYFVAKAEVLTIEYETFIEEFSNLLQRHIIALVAYEHQRRQQMN